MVLAWRMEILSCRLVFGWPSELRTCFKNVTTYVLTTRTPLLMIKLDVGATLEFDLSQQIHWLWGGGAHAHARLGIAWRERAMSIYRPRAGDAGEKPIVILVTPSRRSR